jgi:3D (Asp-Asp-Asp) domain-containing protein
MTISTRCGGRHTADDSGFAMMTVLLFLLIVSLLGATIITVSLNALPASHHEQSYNAAIAAAEAGVDDYIDRLDEDYNYATDENAADPADGNLAFSKCVPVVTGSAGCYTYKVDTSQLDSTGTIYLTSTGKVGSVQRTVKVGLRPFGFLDAMEISDYNLVDPTLFPVVDNNPATTTQDCVYHAYDPNPTTGGTGPNMSLCSGMINYWVTGNVFNGPMQSNDDYYLCGTPQFNDTVDSGDPSTSRAPYWLDPYNGCGGDQPSFAGGPIQGQHTVGFPPAATEMKTFVDPTQAGSGCLYTGPTSITLTGDTMNVVSPETPSDDTHANCVGNGVPLPANGTIFVQDQPASGPGSGPCLSTLAILAYTGSDGCTAGDVFVQGNLTGALTIAADDNIFITGSLTYGSFTASAPRQVLGLIATNTIEIFHPVTQTCTNGQQPNGYYAGWCNLVGSVPFSTASGSPTYTVPVNNPTIDAAMLSLQHAFGVQNFQYGTMSGTGSITLHGVIAGKFMDTEGSFDGSGQFSGYGVNYNYDNRLRDGGLVPPNFLDPTQTFWHRVSYAECDSSSASC